MAHKKTVKVSHNKQSGLDQFVEDLEKVHINIKEQEVWRDVKKSGKTNPNLKALTKNLVENNLSKFSFILSSHTTVMNQRNIERIYSKNEIRQMVCEYLIPEYQHDMIINAVTEYIYGIHVQIEPSTI